VNCGKRAIKERQNSRNVTCAIAPSFCCGSHAWRMRRWSSRNLVVDGRETLVGFETDASAQAPQKGIQFRSVHQPQSNQSIPQRAACATFLFTAVFRRPSHWVAIPISHVSRTRPRIVRASTSRGRTEHLEVLLLLLAARHTACQNALPLNVHASEACL